MLSTRNVVHTDDPVLQVGLERPLRPPASVGGLSSSELTGWFPGDVKPVRVGVYQRTFGDGSHTHSLWNGKRWCWCHSSMKHAATETDKSSFHSLPWRGLASDPEAA